MGSLEVGAAAEVRAFVGEAVVLRCWFRSSAPITEKLTIDWTYRPLAAGGAPEPVSCPLAPARASLPAPAKGQ